MIGRLADRRFASLDDLNEAIAAEVCELGVAGDQVLRRANNQSNREPWPPATTNSITYRAASASAQSSPGYATWETHPSLTGTPPQSPLITRRRSSSDWRLTAA